MNAEWDRTNVAVISPHGVRLIFAIQKLRPFVCYKVRWMKISDVNILNRPLALATKKQVHDLESRLWCRFPAMYLEYVTQLGEGVLGGTFVRIYPPWRIANEYAAWRQRVARCWLWGQAGKELPKDRAVECILIGDSLQGDELVFHPCRPDRLFVLPRHGKKLFAVASDLLSAVDWMCSSGKLTKRFMERDFEPFDSRKDQSHLSSGDSRIGDSLDEIISRAQSWAAQHQLRKQAQTEMKSLITPGSRMELSTESIVLKSAAMDVGYQAEYHLIDHKTHKRLGTCRFKADDSGHGFEFTPTSAYRAMNRKK